MSRNTLSAEHQRIIDSIPLHPEDPPMWSHALCEEHGQLMIVVRWNLTRDPG